MMKFVTSFILAASLFPAVTFAQSKTDVCYVSTHSRRRLNGMGSGIFALGQFHPAAFDEQTIKSFRDKGTSLFVNVGVEYGDFSAASKGEPIEIRVAITVSDKEQNAFEVTEPVVAATSYGKRWGGLSVEQTVAVGQFLHTFSVLCNDGKPRRR